MTIFLATLVTFSLVMALLAWLAAAGRCGHSRLGTCAGDCPGSCRRERPPRGKGAQSHET
jgi:hypothetical protein